LHCNRQAPLIETSQRAHCDILRAVRGQAEGAHDEQTPGKGCNVVALGRGRRQYGRDRDVAKSQQNDRDHEHRSIAKHTASQPMRSAMREIARRERGSSASRPLINYQSRPLHVALSF
jgi:hypothetical protein